MNHCILDIEKSNFTQSCPLKQKSVNHQVFFYIKTNKKYLNFRGKINNIPTTLLSSGEN
jgi:hypothetical protein